MPPGNIWVLKLIIYIALLYGNTTYIQYVDKRYQMLFTEIYLTLSHIEGPVGLKSNPPGEVYTTAPADFWVAVAPQARESTFQKQHSVTRVPHEQYILY